MRVLTVGVTAQQDGNTYYLQVLQDRSTEVETLQALLTVLLVGGVIVVAVAVVFGWLYAQRALVPIRDSFGAQRTALRRQREFAADASHELRTPLTVIRSSLEHVFRHEDRPVAESREALDDIDAEVSHLTAMVDDLLLLARSDSGAVALERMPMDLGDVAFDAASALGRMAAARDVHVQVDPEPAMLDGDPARLRQLVTILVDNAVRHSPRGGVGDGHRAVARARSPGSRWPTRARACARRTWRTSSTASGGRRARRRVARASASRSRAGSSSATAAGSASRTASRTARCSAPSSRRRRRWSRRPRRRPPDAAARGDAPAATGDPVACYAPGILIAGPERPVFRS